MSKYPQSDPLFRNAQPAIHFCLEGVCTQRMGAPDVYEHRHSYEQSSGCPDDGKVVVITERWSQRDNGIDAQLMGTPGRLDCMKRLHDPLRRYHLFEMVSPGRVWIATSDAIERSLKLAGRRGIIQCRAKGHAINR
jgi:hypothetical protein